MMTLDELDRATQAAASSYMDGSAPALTLYRRMQSLLAQTEEQGGVEHRQEAVRLRAWQSAVLASLAAGLGDLPLSRGYAVASRVLGQRAGDPRVISRSYITTAQIEGWPGGDPAKVVTIAAEGLAHTPVRDREQYARLLALLMEGKAKQGDRDGFQHALTRARSAHAYLDPQPSSLFGYSAQQMHSAMAIAKADMGDPSAVGHAEMAVVRCPDEVVAVRVMAEYTKAYALARTGSPDDGIGVALAAVTAHADPSWLERDRSRWVLQALPKGYDSPQAQHLRDAVMS